MKIKTSKADIISGSIGTLAGAMGSGGTHLRRKIIKAPRKSQRQLITQDWLREANKDWETVSIVIKEAWAEYGASLKHINQTGFEVSMTGWNAFLMTYTLMKEVNLSVYGLTVAPPPIKGYLNPPNATFFDQRGSHRIQIIQEGTHGVALYISPKFKNTINKNASQYKKINFFIRRGNIVWSIRNTEGAGRYFLKYRYINRNGSLSLPTVIIQDYTF